MEPEPSPQSVHIVGRYALYEAIAAGGMATVHYGRLLGPVGFSRTVAIKRLHAQYARDPEFVSMFLDEARLAARIRHPNVVPTLDVVATDGELFLVMEYVPGEALARLVRTAASLGTTIPPRIAIAIACGLLRGLHAAHEATNERGEPLGIVHRDVSPQNVLVGIDGQARVLDFGVAKAAGRLQTTRDGKLKGKLAYMSPEQLRGKAIDRRTDIFAAAVVLWEGLTGRRLFKGDNEGAIITQILEGNVQPPSAAIPASEMDDANRAIVKAVDEITLKGLAPQADQRWDTARAMAAALEKAAPPAGVSEVSEWVEQFAKDVLVTRAKQVADIESHSSVGPPNLSAIQAESSDADASARFRAMPARPVAPSTDETRSARIDVSTLSLSSDPEVAALRPRRRKALLGVVGTVGAVGALAVFVALRSLPAPPPALGASASASASVVTPAPPPPPVAPEPSVRPAVPAVAKEEPAVPASATPSPAVPSTGAKPAPPRPTPRPPAVAAPAAVPASHPPPSSCNPPYTYDAQGLKHFKPECL